jgi:hypothetical protein
MGSRSPHCLTKNYKGEIMETVRKLDKGTILRLTLTEDDVTVNIEAGTDPRVLFRKPSGTWLDRPATIANNKVVYTVEADLLDEVGNWKAEAHLVIGDWEGSSEQVAFKVEEAFL